MQPFPHHYSVAAHGTSHDDVTLKSAGLPPLLTAPPSSSVDPEIAGPPKPCSSLRVRLEVVDGTDEAQARRLLEKAEQACLVTNSLKFAPHLQAEVRFVPAAEPVAAWHQVD